MLTGIGALKVVEVALCGVRCVNLHGNTIKKLRIHYSYNKQLENGKYFIKCIAKIYLKGKLKALGLSKITHPTLVKITPPSITNQLNKIQNIFIWNRLNPKIKNLTINNKYENSGLKHVNNVAKKISLKSSRSKTFFDGNFLAWKMLPLHIIHKSLGKYFLHHCNFPPNKKLTMIFPK